MFFDPHLSLILGKDDRAALLVYEVHRRCGLQGGVDRAGEHWIWETFDGWLTAFASWKSARVARYVVKRARNLGVLVTRQTREGPMLYRVDYDVLRQLYAAADIPIPNWIPEIPSSPVTLDMMVEADIQQTAVAAWEDTESGVTIPDTREDIDCHSGVTKSDTPYGSHKLISLLDTHTQPKSKHIRHTLLASSSEVPSDFIVRFCEVAGEQDRGYGPIVLKPNDYRLRTMDSVARAHGTVNPDWAEWLWYEIEDMCDRGRRPHTSLGMATAIFQRMVANGHDLSAEPPEPTERLIQSSARY